MEIKSRSSKDLDSSILHDIIMIRLHSHLIPIPIPFPFHSHSH